MEKIEQEHRTVDLGLNQDYFVEGGSYGHKETPVAN